MNDSCRMCFLLLPLIIVEAKSIRSSKLDLTDNCLNRPYCTVLLITV